MRAADIRVSPVAADPPISTTDMAHHLGAVDPANLLAVAAHLAAVAAVAAHSINGTGRTKVIEHAMPETLDGENLTHSINGTDLMKATEGATPMIWGGGKGNGTIIISAVA
ncbi:hypothetical protein Bra5_CH00571 [Rhizobium phaseoli Brasil 5]|nr:hypothetical protein Bra5_CH00571 [Rhizobium phaseoli Brasil 5]